MLYTALAVLQVIICMVLIFLVLLHSGKDAGMSGAFGVGVAGGTTGGSLMERNLDRWTIFFAVVLVANTLVLLGLYVSLSRRSSRRRAPAARGRASRRS